MSGHSCYFKNCPLPVTHNIRWSVTVDGKIVDENITWMCEHCFQEYVKLWCERDKSPALKEL